MAGEIRLQLAHQTRINTINNLGKMYASFFATAIWTSFQSETCPRDW